MKKTKMPCHLGVEPDSAPQTSPDPSLLSQGWYYPDDNAEASSPCPSKHFLKGLYVYMKEYGYLSEFKSHISPVDLTLKWKRPFQTEFVESNQLCSDDGVDPPWEQEKGLLI